MKSASTATAAAGSDPTGVAHTDFLKQTARLLCDRDVNDGKLDASQLDRMIIELRGARLADTERVLRTLRDDNELQKIVNSIGERW